MSPNFSFQSENQPSEQKHPILVCEILPSKSNTDGSVRAANLAVDKVLANLPSVYRVKTHDRFLDSSGKLLDFLFTDGTHLTPAGYEVLAEAVKAALSRHTGLLKASR